MFIRITLKDKSTFFINETREGLVTVDSIDKAFSYQSTLEFKVSWKKLEVNKPRNSFYTRYDKTNVVKFESIDQYTVETKTFGINDIEIPIENSFYVDSETFKRLVMCSAGSSHFVYDKDGKWIGFPTPEDYHRTSKIVYYRRGLTHTIEDQAAWVRRYDKESWHPAYNVHHKCLLNPYIQQVYLMNKDCCFPYTVYEKKLE